jgi:hypothetical protein
MRQGMEGFVHMHANHVAPIRIPDNLLSGSTNVREFL